MYCIICSILYHFSRDCLKRLKLKTTLRRKKNLPKRYENSLVTPKSTKYHSDIKMHGKNRKRLKMLIRLVCQGTKVVDKSLFITPVYETFENLSYALF